MQNTQGQLVFLPEDVKKRWIGALRSEKYKQAMGALYIGNDDNGIPQCCCLGVLEDICGTDLNKILDEPDCTTLVNNKKVSNVPIEIFENVFYDEESRDLEGILVDMNDSDKKSFKEISDFIEKNL